MLKGPEAPIITFKLSKVISAKWDFMQINMTNLLLLNGTDLVLWADRRDAQAMLPQLLKRLAFASLEKIERIYFRSDEGVQLEGYDGIVCVASGNAFVPDGLSVWELSSQKDVKGKADEDYAKRTENPLGINPAGSTFVFITPRRWSNKEKWAEARKQEGVWKDVRAYDADDLATWLEQVPSVHIWFSILLGKHPPGVNDLLSFWEEWSETTDPPMIPELVTNSREKAVTEIHRWLRGQPTALGLKGATRDEALAFFAAAVLQMPDEEKEAILARAIIVDDVAACRQLSRSRNSLILVPIFTDRSTVPQAAAAGHHVFIPLDQSEPPLRGTIQLSRLRYEGAKKALQDMGISEDRARDLAVIARRSIGALRRKIAISPAILKPEWAKPETARALLFAVLAGQWDNRNIADQEAIARLAGRESPDLRDLLIQWANESDPPVRLVGNTWMVACKEDAWSLLARYLTRDALDRFEAVVLDVLGEVDPRYDLPAKDRWLAGTLDKELKRSALLRKGLAETLGIMAAYSDSYPLGDAWTGQEWAARIVRELLDLVTDWKLWASLSPLMQLFAEAAPDTFLDAAERDLSGEKPILADLFQDVHDGQYHLMISSPHTELLWALELLAWSPEYLSNASLLLAMLARIDPGGKLGNRPLQSLHNIFLSWYPCTAASLEQRLRVIDNTRKREPQVAWSLLAGLLPQSTRVAHRTAKPNWRDWVPEEDGPVTYNELFKATGEILSRLLEDVGTDGERWRTLIGALDNLPAQFDTIIEKLYALDLKTLSLADRLHIWSSLRSLISRHLEYPDARWALQKEAVEHLQHVYARFEPEDPVMKRSWLFSNRPYLLEGGYSNWRERDEAVSKARVQAIEELLELAGLEKVLELASQVDRPWIVGFALGQGKALDGQEELLLNKALGSHETALRDIALGFLQGRASLKGVQWLEDLRSWEVWHAWKIKQRADYYRCLPFTGHTWDILEGEDADTQRLYWSQVEGFGHYGLQIEDCERALLRFVEYGCLGEAMEFLTLHIYRSSPPFRPILVAGVLEQIIEGSKTHKINWGNLSYDIWMVLEFLEKYEEVEEVRLAQLEWFFLPLYRHGKNPPKVLSKALSEDPSFFVEVIKWMSRADGEGPMDLTEEQIARVRLGYELLDQWRRPPGLNEDGSIDSVKLRAWISRARELASEIGRREVCDQHIGQMLIYYPEGADKAWPHEALRELIEELASNQIESGIRTGIYNSRGVVTKAFGEGGGQERVIAERYHTYAKILSDGWPRTARLMRQIAESYESDARQEDMRAELDEDLRW